MSRLVATPRSAAAPLLAWLLAVAIASWASAESPQAKPPKNMRLFLLVGQSNMAGRGKIAKDDKTPHPNVWMFDKRQQWTPAVAPLHFDKPAVVGVGIGRSFALELLKDEPEAAIGLIPAAAGGSPIDSWKPGGYHSQTKSHPYDDAIRRAKAARSHGQIVGILWHQGESDSKPELADSYEKKLHALIARFRKELDLPTVPFVAGQMGQFEERPWSDAKKRVDRAHRELPKHVPRTAFASSDKLKHKGDEVHFDSASYRELGRRYASAFAELSGMR